MSLIVFVFFLTLSNCTVSSNLISETKKSIKSDLYKADFLKLILLSFLKTRNTLS